MFVLTDDPLPVGTTLRVSLELPDHEGEEGPVVPCLARVNYIVDGTDEDAPAGMGLDLIEVPAAIIQALLVEALADSTGSEPTDDTLAHARILVVDDDRLSRNHVCRALSARWSDIETAENGLEALGKALASPPDLILSDVEMPGMDGWQLLRVVRSRPKLAKTPVIFLTRLRGERERLRGYHLGVDDFVAKPADPADLRARVSGLLVRTRGRPSGNDVLRGDLAHVSLSSVLSFIQQERRSGNLLVASGRRLATLVIRDGDVVQVRLTSESAAATPLDRLFEVLDWATGTFELAEAEAVSTDEIGMSTSGALLEWARLKDEDTL